MQKPREIAFHILARRELGQDFVENLLDSELSQAHLSPLDRGLCTELVYGTVRRQRTLDWLIERKTEPGRNQKAELRILLRLGLYQMFWLGRVPDHAAVHETVEIAKKVGFAPQSGFLNAVLRAYTREKAEIEKALSELAQKDLALGYSHPDWLVERWMTRWGTEKTRQLLDWNNRPASTFARVNLLKTDPERLTRQWLAENVKFTPKNFPWLGEFTIFQLDSHPSLASMRSFQQGLFYVQDPSTLLAASQLKALPGEAVLDTCSAPGGKTTLIAQMMQNRGRLIAEDVEPERLKLVRENVVRLGITCVHFSQSEGSSAAPIEGAPQFDRILVDAPCSNTGVLRRRVDLRWRIRPDEIRRLSETQLRILRHAASRLKPGGTLIYSTCSLESEENTDLVKQFLAEHPQFKLENEQELLPFVTGVDGAYVAKLKLG